MDVDETVFIQRQQNMETDTKHNKMSPRVVLGQIQVKWAEDTSILVQTFSSLVEETSV